ncbi:hypothetical protein C2S51_001460 [Perilla frutescens var. frutescens]|nr:hypothetical protein C2S51_001460 [Perilla frutescens var. frutescens]
MNFPRDVRNQYVLTGAATPDGATVQKAKHVNPATGEKFSLGIKIFDTHKIEDINSFSKQLQEAESFDHQNIVKVHCYFKTGDQLWVVMSPPGIPIRSIIRSYFQQGLPEKDVAYILKETLKALHYMHDKKNAACENLGAGCVNLDDECRVKIGISSITQDHRSNNVVTVPEFVADYGEGKDKATDTLMLGFLALEMFYGEIPSCDEFMLSVADEFGETQPLRKNIGGLSSCFRTSTVERRRRRRRRRMPAELTEVVVACLCRDAEARPTTNLLMKYRLFQKVSSGTRLLMKFRLFRKRFSGT